MSKCLMNRFWWDWGDFSEAFFLDGQNVMGHIGKVAGIPKAVCENVFFFQQSYKLVQLYI